MTPLFVARLSITTRLTSIDIYKIDNSALKIYDFVIARFLI